MVSFIHNGSEITTWMGHTGIAPMPKAQNPKQHLKDNKIFFILNFKLQIIKLAQRHWSSTPTH